MKTAALALLLLLPQLAKAQVGAGTIVVLDFSKDKLSVAADSRITIEKRKPLDSFCKISVFGHRIVFASFGAEAWLAGPFDPVQGWDNPHIAGLAVAAKANPGEDADSEIRDIGEAWANTVAAHWRTLYQWDAKAVIKAAKTSGIDFLTGAIFAEARNGTVHWRYFAVMYYTAMVPPVTAMAGEWKDCWPCGEHELVCSLGRRDTTSEFCSQKSARANAEATGWKVSPLLASEVSRETLHAVRLVDLAIAFDPVRGIGGPIDALEIHTDGTVTWIFRKGNCSEDEFE